jgi:hypothetical protein
MKPLAVAIAIIWLLSMGVYLWVTRIDDGLTHTSALPVPATRADEHVQPAADAVSAAPVGNVAGGGEATAGAGVRELPKTLRSAPSNGPVVYDAFSDRPEEPVLVTPAPPQFPSSESAVRQKELLGELLSDPELFARRYGVTTATVEAMRNREVPLPDWPPKD